MKKTQVSVSQQILVFMSKTSPIQSLKGHTDFRRYNQNVTTNV